MAMKEIIQGHDLMVFVDGKSIALATSHSLDISSSTVSCANKDIEGGAWDATKVASLSWSMQTDNLYSTTDFSNLFNLMTSRTQVDVLFKVNTASLGQDGHYDSGSTLGAYEYSGKAYITSLSANAPDGDNATFSATFSGYGKLENQNSTPIV